MTDLEVLEDRTDNHVRRIQAHVDKLKSCMICYTGEPTNELKADRSQDLLSGLTELVRECGYAAETTMRLLARLPVD